MGNIPSKPVVVNQEWTNGVTKLNQTNLTSGVNQNITNIKTAVDGIIDALGGPGADPKNFEEITWTNLKSLRDTGQLVPGKQYRITDYITTTAEENTRSAGHQFDVIVKALSAGKLSEEAYAILHEGDTYFANSNLSAWKLWYSIDNDTNRFDWADATNGKGVIYRMIDEFRNDLPYDFKNIIYSFVIGFSYKQWGSTYFLKRDSSLDADGYYGWRCSVTPTGWPNPYCFSTVETPTTSMALYKDTSGTSLSFGSITSVSLKEFETYTFNCVYSSINHDVSMEGLNESQYSNESCYNNVIKEYYSSNKLQLNWNVFYSTSRTFGCYSNTFEANCRYNTFGYSCYSNTFGVACYNNIFGNDCYSNIFGNNCYSNTSGTQFYSNIFGNDCYSNTFGNNCHHNIFGNNCYSNTFDQTSYNNVFGNGYYSNTSGSSFSENVFGNNCYSNTFGKNFSNNTFDARCSNNTFGDTCHENAFGAYCGSNTFGDRCIYNTFGAYCQSNTFGEYCISNTFDAYCRINSFGNNCQYNTFGSGCSNITFGDSSSTIDYCRYIIIDNSCSYIYLSSDDTSASSFNYLQNVHIHLGVTGSSSSNRLSISVADRKLAYSTDYYANGSKSIVLS